MGRPATVTINLDALRHNYRIAQQLSSMSDGGVMAVVKADAYSHGATACATALADIASGFAVACIEEALELRVAGIKQPILLLEGFFESAELSKIDQYRLDVVIHHQYQVDALVAYPLDHPVRVWLKMDSGMGRVGFIPEEYRYAWKQLNNLPWVRDIVLMSHFACADETDNEHAQQQLATFNAYTNDLPGQRSLCNSAAMVALPQARSDWNRPGLLLYGVSPFSQSHDIEQMVQPVMEFEFSHYQHEKPSPPVIQWVMAVNGLPSGRRALAWSPLVMLMVIHGTPLAEHLCLSMASEHRWWVGCPWIC